MGLFDIFTGDSARRAAEQNRQLLTANKAEGTTALQTGQTNSLGALDAAASAYQPLSALGSKYGGGTSLYLDSLGINGAEGNARATGAFQAGPGYNWRVDQALDGVNRKANATGGLMGGNTLAALSDRAGNLASEEYGSWQDRLGGLISPELAATGAAATGVAGANTNKAGVYANTANSIANLGTKTTEGIAGQNTQEANAVTAANGNLWRMGLQGATALASGGTSLLGGAGGIGAGLGSLGITYGTPGTAGSNLFGPVA